MACKTPFSVGEMPPSPPASLDIVFMADEKATENRGALMTCSGKQLTATLAIFNELHLIIGFQNSVLMSENPA